MVEHRFTLKLKLKECDREFMEGAGKGVIAFHDIVIEAPEGQEALVAVSLMRACDEMRDRYIEVVVEPRED